MLTKLLHFLDGKKTHLVVVVFAVFNVLLQTHTITIDPNTVSLVNKLLAAAGLSALRLALN